MFTFLKQTFWNYVASILCSFFFLRYVHSELWNYAASISWFQFYLRHLHSAFWNYVASMPCSFFHLRYLKFCIPHSGIILSRFYVPFFHGMCILELCRLDSIITADLRTVFGIQRIYYTVFMLPRFHRVRTSRPGNSL